MNKKYLFLLGLLLLNNLLLFSKTKQNNSHIVSINEIHDIWLDEWNFKPTTINLGNDETYDDSNWYKTSLDPWQLTIPELINYNGSGWFNLPLKINTDVNDLSLQLPFCFGNYKLYINKKLLYTSNSLYGSKPILINIPISYLTDEVTNLNLEVDSYSGWGGFSGPMRIGSTKIINNSFINYTIQHISMSFIPLFLFFYFLIMYFFRKNEQYNLFFSFLCLFISLFNFGFSGFILYIFNYSWAYWLLTFLGGIGMYLFPILFIHSFFNLKLRIIGKIFTWFYSFLALFVFVEYIFTGQIFFFNKYLYMAFNMSYILVVIYLITISIQIAIKKLQYSKTMLLATILLTITFVYSMLGFMNIIIAPPLIGEGFFLMALMFAIVLAKRAAQTHSDLEFAHADLEFTNAENVALNDTLEEKVEERTLELKEKNAEITQSIEYSALIQNSMLPSDEQFSKVFSDHYAVWKPKDTVGGDFYWFKQLEEGFILAIIDCTGHGVPGALLTMTATAALERIVTHINSTDPGLMLKEMNKIVKRLLSQDNPYDIKDDGLDIGLCYYNSNDKKMTFAGSKIRLFIDDDGELLEIRGDRQGIGYKRSKAYYSYTNHVINVTDKKTFHMTTDGFLDQSGGDKGFGYGWTKYRKLLIKNRDLPLKDQIERIEEELLDYQGDESQRDDITLLGFKIKLD